MSELIDAVYDNDIDLVGQLLNNNVDIELRNQYGDTALIAAINQAPDPPFRRADIEVSIQVIRLLLENGALPNIQNNEGRTALMKASQCIERIRIVELLLERGADPNIPDDDGDTALIWASCYTSGEMVDLLLNNGADPNIQSNEGQTALIGASEYGHTDIVRRLLDPRVDIDIDIQNGDGDTALNLAIKDRGRWVEVGPEAGDQGRRTEIVRLLLERGADPNIPDNDGHIALTIAERRGRTEIVRLLRRHMGLQKAKQRLALSKLLGLTKDYDTFIEASESLGEEPYNPRVTGRMIVEEENERMDLQKAKQRLALSKLLGLTKDYDTFIEASEYHKGMPYHPDVDERMREEEKRDIDHLNWLQSFSQYGGRRRRRRKKTMRKRYY